MKRFFFALMLFGFAQISATTQITFQNASANEILDMQAHVISFYSQELFKAGLFQDIELAYNAAKEETTQDPADINFYLITTDTENTPCGYIAYSMNEQTAYLDAIYLDEQYRGCGLGKIVLATLESKLKEAGIKLIRLYVFAHNQAATHVYKKQGYTIEKTYFNKEDLVGYHMQKTL
ncbi:MAG: GNAT family N-acetyltransferase [Chlamydiales bacterium]|nr:GNAT family N-acetyltransferase [Chlamydiales bacterium]